MIEYVALFPQSTFATIMLGKYDLAVEFVMTNMAELREIMNRIKKQFSQDITDHDIFIMKEHSVNWFPYEPDKNKKNY